MEYKNISEIAEAIYHHAEIDYDAVRDFLTSHHIHPDTLVAYPGLPQAYYPSNLMDLAVHEGNVEMAKTLLELGSDPHFDYDDGTVTPYTELQYSNSEDSAYVDTSKIEIMKLFLEKGFDVDRPMGKDDCETFFEWVRFAFYEDPDSHRGEILSLLEPYHKE